MAAVADDTEVQEPATELFFTACADSYTHEQLLVPQMRERGFTELPAEEAARYLGGMEGRAWDGVLRAKRLVVALMPERGCTVIVHDGDPKEILAALELWRAAAEAAGIATKTESGPAKDYLRTTYFELRGGKVSERWVVTVSEDPSSAVKAMLSWSRL